MLQFFGLVSQVVNLGFSLDDPGLCLVFEISVALDLSIDIKLGCDLAGMDSNFGNVARSTNHLFFVSC